MTSRRKPDLALHHKPITCPCPRPAHSPSAAAPLGLDWPGYRTHLEHISPLAASPLTSGSSGMGEPNPLPPQILRQGQSVLLPHQLWEALLSPSACVASRPASRKGLPPRRPSFGRSSSSSAWQPFVQWNLFVMLGGHCIHLCAPSAQQVPGAVKNCLDVIKFNK